MKKKKYSTINMKFKVNITSWNLKLYNYFIAISSKKFFATTHQRERSLVAKDGIVVSVTTV